MNEILHKTFQYILWENSLDIHYEVWCQYNIVFTIRTTDTPQPQVALDGNPQHMFFFFALHYCGGYVNQ